MAENVHTAEELAQFQSAPLSVKISMTKYRISQWVKEFGIQGVYLSWSGGKDSTVLKHIIDGMYKQSDDEWDDMSIPAVFVNTGLEYPEIQNFVREVKAGKYDCFSSNVEILRPEMRFDEVIKKYGYPVVSKCVSSYASSARRNPDCQRARWLRGDDKTMFVSPKWYFLVDAPFNVSAYCCSVMKKKPMHKYGKETGRHPIMGVMADEGLNRKNSWIQYGCNAFDAPEPSSRPMSFWTEQDVLEYIVKFNVPYASCYGDIVTTDPDGNEYDANNVFADCCKLSTTGCSRTGCMFCMFGAHLEKEPNRFQMMKKTHPNQYSYCMKPVEEGGLGLKSVLDYIGVKYE